MKLAVLVLMLVCGAHSLTLPRFSSGDIIDGEEAQPGEAPFIASLEFLGSHYCAASIINENTLLTAGHCLPYPPSRITVKAGIHLRSNNDGVQSAQVSRTIVHPLYTWGVSPYDIGIIKLATPLNLNSLKTDHPVDRVRLGNAESSAAGDGILYGWGKDRSDNLPDALQKLDTRIIEYAECKRELPDNSPIDPVNICTHYKREENPFEGVCSGDSGGPLVKRNSSGSVELVGIVSWGFLPCIFSTYPSVYTYVPAFSEWISSYL